MIWTHDCHGPRSSFLIGGIPIYAHFYAIICNSLSKQAYIYIFKSFFLFLISERNVLTASEFAFSYSQFDLKAIYVPEAATPTPRKIPPDKRDKKAICANK